MNRIWICVLLLTGLPAIAGATDADFKWHGYQDALDLAEETDRLVLVDVYTTWCGWCKKLDKQVYSRDDVKDYLSRKFVSVKLNAEDTETMVRINDTAMTYAQLTAAYGVRSYPTTLFLRADGKLLYGLRGYHPPERFLKALQYFGEGTYLDHLKGAEAGE